VVLRFAGDVRHSFSYAAGLEHLGRRQRLLAALDRLATSAARDPLGSLLALLVLNLGLAALFAALGVLLFNDRAEFFRELMPGTWLSFAELVLIAAIAWSIHERTAGGKGWRRYNNFWALSTGVFLVLAFDEISQATVFIADWLSDHADLSPAAGFRDLDAVLISLLLLGSVLVLAPKAIVLRHHWRSLVLFAIGGALGVWSEGLDAFMKSTSSEFALEETLKLASEPFLIAGYLMALFDVLYRSGRGGAAVEQPQSRRREPGAEHEDAAGEPTGDDVGRVVGAEVDPGEADADHDDSGRNGDRHTRRPAAAGIRRDQRD